jgi:hypothetical protein
LLRTKKFKHEPSAGVVMLTLFQDFCGPVLKYDHCAMLEEHFKPCIYSKLRGMLRKEVVFHHDDA